MPLLKPSDPRLYEPSAPVADIQAEVLPKIPVLLLELNRARNSVALSAPQVGIMLRFFVYRSPALSVVVNPVILSREGVQVSREGCLSWPGKFTTLARSKVIRVRWQDENGTLHEKDISGRFACVFQHEIDHLDGKCIFPRPQPAPAPAAAPEPAPAPN